MHLVFKSTLFCKPKQGSDKLYHDESWIWRTNLLKKRITKIRLSAHSLFIETGRYRKTHLVQRICPLCKCELEEEFHFALKCYFYTPLRCNGRNLSVFKLIPLLNTHNVKDLRNLLGIYNSQKLGSTVLFNNII